MHKPLRDPHTEDVLTQEGLRKLHKELRNSQVKNVLMKLLVRKAQLQDMLMKFGLRNTQQRLRKKK